MVNELATLTTLLQRYSRANGGGYRVCLEPSGRGYIFQAKRELPVVVWHRPQDAAKMIRAELPPLAEEASMALGDIMSRTQKWGDQCNIIKRYIEEAMSANKAD